MGTWGGRRHLAVRHTTTRKIPGFTPNTGVSQPLEVSAGIVLEFKKFTASPVTIPFVLHLFYGRKLGVSKVESLVCFSKHGLGPSRDKWDRVLHARNQSDTGVSLVWSK